VPDYTIEGVVPKDLAYLDFAVRKALNVSVAFSTNGKDLIIHAPGDLTPTQINSIVKIAQAGPPPIPPTAQVYSLEDVTS